MQCKKYLTERVNECHHAKYEAVAFHGENILFIFAINVPKLFHRWTWAWTLSKEHVNTVDILDNWGPSDFVNFL